VADVLPGAPSNAIALTFDDGPHPAWTSRVLDLLAHYRVPATFFMIGGNVRAQPALARRAVAEGHAVGNHTYDHPLPFTALSSDRVNAEIDSTQQAIAEVTGYSPSLFRAPGGEWDDAALSAAAEHRLVPVGWAVDPRDWSRPGTGVIVQRLSAARAGDILLCHDGGGDRSETLAALDQMLPVLLGRGYQFVALAPPAAAHAA
jgi:peptidoglycan/xylan/chitin deacetylase (PgdA/CDA1 family)